MSPTLGISLGRGWGGETMSVILVLMTLRHQGEKQAAGCSDLELKGQV